MSDSLITDEPAPRFKVVPIGNGYTIEDTRSGEHIGYFATRKRAERQVRLHNAAARLFPKAFGGDR